MCTEIFRAPRVGQFEVFLIVEFPRLCIRAYLPHAGCGCSHLGICSTAMVSYPATYCARIFAPLAYGIRLCGRNMRKVIIRHHGQWCAACSFQRIVLKELRRVVNIMSINNAAKIKQRLRSAVFRRAIARFAEVGVHASRYVDVRDVSNHACA